MRQSVGLVNYRGDCREIEKLFPPLNNIHIGLYPLYCKVCYFNCVENDMKYNHRVTNTLVCLSEDYLMALDSVG